MADSDGQIDYDYTEMNMCFNEKHTTNFSGGKNMDEMKAMLSNARPDLVTGVATGWKGLAAQLTSIQTEFEKEVARIQAHWTGAAADGFAAKAKQVSTSIGNTAKYASHTSIAMTNVGAALEPIKDEVLAMEKPSRVSSLLNSAGDGFTRSGEGTDKDIAAGKGAQEVLDRNHDDLSAGREAQLKMASKMETLGAAYNSQAMAMGSWSRAQDEVQDYPPDPGGITPTPVAAPTGTTPRSPQRAIAGAARVGQAGSISSSKPVKSPSGITGGVHKPTAPQPQVGTAIDGVGGVHTGAPSAGGGAGPAGGGISGGIGVGGGAGFAGGAIGAGAAGMAGRAGAAGMAGRSGAAGMAGRAGAGAAGRTGAGGVGGADAAKGANGRVGGTARGGVVGGTPKASAGAGAGRGTTGGSGLHSSRGATGKGASAVRKGGIAGAPGARTGRAKDQEQREGERPDYLVEDEETWTPQTNAAPRVIE